jgi:hypothetical protein
VGEILKLEAGFKENSPEKVGNNLGEVYGNGIISS